MWETQEKDDIHHKIVRAVMVTKKGVCLDKRETLVLLHMIDTLRDRVKELKRWVPHGYDH